MMENEDENNGDYSEYEYPEHEVESEEESVKAVRCHGYYDSDEEMDLCYFWEHCSDISQDCPRLQYVETPRLRDIQAVELGAVLAGNTHLNGLAATISINLSTEAARALVNGILQSKLKTFTLCYLYDSKRPSPAVMQILYTEPMKTVSTMWFDVAICDEDAVQLVQALSTTSATSPIEKLCFKQGNLTHGGAVALAKAIRCSHLKKLEISGTPTRQIPDILCTIYCYGILQSHIQDISLSGSIGEMAALATVLPQLCSLTFRYVELNLEEVRVLSESLSHPNLLEHLTVEKCKLVDEHIVILSAALRGNMRIKTLGLGDNQIGDAGIIALAENWSNDSTIEKLDLRKNIFGPIGTRRLVQAYSTQAALKHLDLGLNKNIGYDGLMMIAEALRNNTSTTLTEIDVNNAAYFVEPKVGDDERAKAHHDNVSKVAQAFLDGARRGVYLRVLRVDWAFHRNTMEEIVFYIQMNRLCGRELLLLQHKLPPSFWCHLLAKFNMRSSVIFYYLHELPILFSASVPTTN